MDDGDGGEGPSPTVPAMSDLECREGKTLDKTGCGRDGCVT